MVLPAYRYAAKLARLIDGDTYVLTLDLGFRASLTVPIRLHGWNCPERSTEAGKVAAEAAGRWLDGSRPIVVQTFRDARSFERWIADVWVDGVHLGERLEAAGLAVRA